jgi:transcriptional regulator with XRE-family HTH domain
MSVKFDDFLKEQLKDPEIKKEYDDLQPERAIIQALIDARLQTGMTQKELSEKTGIAQGDISKLERGNSNPSIRTLQRLAAGMGMSIQLKFLPNGNVERIVTYTSSVFCLSYFFTVYSMIQYRLTR